MTSYPGVVVDLCTQFNAASSPPVWTFSTIDMTTYPAGTYTMTITATTGSNSDVSATHLFSVNLIDPCLTATITASATNPFVDDSWSIGSAMQ